MKRAAILLLFALPAFAAEPSKFTLPLGSAADPLTVLGPAAVCADQQIALWSGASNTSLQCSVLTVADTTGNITGPSGGFSIIGGTGATDDLILDGSTGTAGSVTITEAGAVRTANGSSTASAIGNAATNGIFFGAAAAAVDIVANSVFVARWNSAGLVLGSTTSDPQLRFADTTPDGAQTVQLAREAAGTLALGMGTQASTFRVYGTGAGLFSTDYERLSLSCDGTADCTIATETAGTGGDDVNLNLTPAGVGTINLTRARLVPSAAPPVTCAAGTEGALYLDSDTHKLCYCNATGWVLASDDTTGCS